VEAATTDYICTAEADFIHAPGYFQFTPPEWGTFYIPSPIYVLFARSEGRQGFYRKDGCQGAVVGHRALFLDCLEKMLSPFPKWSKTMERTYLVRGLFRHTPWTTFPTDTPTVTFKTDRAMHAKTGVRGRSLSELHYWGRSLDLMQDYACHR
jgi:hypothetical protein